MIEADLTTALKSICPRVFPDVAPEGTDKPYITYQAIGGQDSRLLDNTHAGMRNTLMQINAWATTRAEALSLIRQVEDALAASPAMLARTVGDSISTYEEDTKLYGSIQRFSIWANR
jgi:Protein of unknown function (DUF3168)